MGYKGKYQVAWLVITKKYTEPQMGFNWFCLVRFEAMICRLGVQTKLRNWGRRNCFCAGKTNMASVASTGTLELFVSAMRRFFKESTAR